MNRKGMSMRVLALRIAITYVMGLVLPATSPASIVVNKSIDGVVVGWGATSVRHLLGKPSSAGTCTSPGPIGPCGPVVEFWTYTPRDLKIFFVHSRVQALTTTSTKERTDKGIGPGVSVKLLKNRYPAGKVAPYSGTQGWWLPGGPTNGSLFTVFVGGRGITLNGTLAIVEIGSWEDKYSCDFFAC
jgi:hypothetical protein